MKQVGLPSLHQTETIKTGLNGKSLFYLPLLPPGQRQAFKSSMQFAEVPQVVPGELKPFDQSAFQEPSSEFHLQRSPLVILKCFPLEIP